MRRNRSDEFSGIIQRRRASLVVVLVLSMTVGAASPAPPPSTGAPPRSAGCAASTIETGRRLERTIDVHGTLRSYILDVPDRLRPGVPVPLMFDFHGLGHSAAGVWKVSAFRELARRHDFISVYPDGLPVSFPHQGKTYRGAGWEVSRGESNRDVEFTSLLLDHLERVYCIDRSRVFATGFSNGAYFSHLLGCAMSDRFAAIAPVSGGRVPPGCAPVRGVPVLILHGRQDEIVPLQHGRSARDSWIEMNQCRAHTGRVCERHHDCRDNAVVEYCEGDFAHRWPPQATARVWEFFQLHSLSAVGRPTRATQVDD